MACCWQCASGCSRARRVPTRAALGRIGCRRSPTCRWCCACSRTRSVGPIAGAASRIGATASLAAELVGTGTGWPFGSYTYGDALGSKVLERVPIAIPLSWFSLGLTSYLLARIVLARLGRATTGPAALVLGVWIFVVWDL